MTSRYLLQEAPSVYGSNERVVIEASWSVVIIGLAIAALLTNEGQTLLDY